MLRSVKKSEYENVSEIAVKFMEKQREVDICGRLLAKHS
jgi:hypothetical protein